MKIAITGTIASGKSLCSKILKEHGFDVFDSDSYAKSCYDINHPAYKKIVDLFGEQILDSNNNVIHKKVADIIFKDASYKSKLESIIHPFVKEEIIKQSYKDPFICEIPLLYEVGWDSLFDYVLLITSDKDIAMDRCINLRGYSKQEAINRINNQKDVNYKIERANYVLYNNKTIDDFRKQVLTWIKDMGIK